MDSSPKQIASEHQESDQDCHIKETETCIVMESDSDPESNALSSSNGHKEATVQSDLLQLERSESDYSGLTKNDALPGGSGCVSEPFENLTTERLFGTYVRLPYPRGCLAGPTETSGGSTESILEECRSSTSNRHRPFNIKSRPFNIKRRSFNMMRRPFNMKRRPFNMKRRPFNMKRRPFNIKRRPFNIKRRPFNIKRRPFNIKRRPFIIKRRPSSSQLGPPSKKLGLSSKDFETFSSESESSSKVFETFSSDSESSSTDSEPINTDPGPSRNRPGPSTDRPGPSTDRHGPSTDRPGPSRTQPSPCGEELGPFSTDSELFILNFESPSTDFELFSLDFESPSTDSEPINTEPGPSSTLPGPSSNRSGPFNDQPGPSSNQPGLSSNQPGPSSNQPGPSSNQPEPIDSQPITTNSSEGGTSTTSSGSNFPILEVVQISLPTANLCAEDKDFINGYNNKISSVVHKLRKNQRAANDTKNFVQEIVLRFLRIPIETGHLMLLQAKFNKLLFQLETINTDLARIISQAEPHMASCMKTVSLLNDMAESFSLPPQSPEFLHIQIKAQVYLKKLGVSMLSLADIMRQAKSRYRIYKIIRRRAISYYDSI